MAPQKLTSIMSMPMSTHLQPVGADRPATRVRGEIADELKWDLGHIYPDWKSWEEGLNELKQLVESFLSYEGTLAEGPEHFLEVNELSTRIGILLFKVHQYPSLMSAEDTRNNDVQARFEKVRIVLARFDQDAAWYTPELLRVPLATLRGWIDQVKGLEPYRFGIEETFRLQQHVLDEAGERLLALATQLKRVPSQSYAMLADADVEFPTVELSTGEKIVASHSSAMQVIQTSRVQADREAAFKGWNSTFVRHTNTYASIYNGVLQRDWFMTQARRYGSSLEAALDENNIPTAVVENLIRTARDGSQPLRRYHQLRRAALGLDRYRYFDGYVPLVEVDWKIPYSEARPLVLGSVEIFGASYQETVARAFSERWIDVYENEGKRSGAFSSGVYGVHPYMMLNYTQTLADAFTLAHEMGHTLHTVLSFERQHYATSSYTIFVAEVASMANEALLLDLLLEREKDPARRISLLQYAIDDICAGFYRQTMFADFELRAHCLVEAGEPITADRLCQLYLEVLRDFFGESLDDQEWYDHTWAHVPHFFASPFYVFQYATSKAASSLIHRAITSGDDASRTGAVERYLELLSSGGNDHPTEQLRRAGVDFSTPEPIQAQVDETVTLVTRLEDELRALGLLKR